MPTLQQSDELLRRLSVQNNGVPIYVQLREQILQAVGDGMLAPGAQLPTMRQVAVTLRIDLNTVQRAYAALEREGVLVTIRGRGSFITEAPPVVDPAARAAAVDGLAYQAMATAQSLGVDPLDVAAAIMRLAPGIDSKSRRKS